MPLSDDIMIGVLINNVQGITGKTYSIRDLVRAYIVAADGRDGDYAPLG